MAYDVSKLAKLAALKALAEKVKSDYATKADLKKASDSAAAAFKSGKVDGNTVSLYTSEDKSGTAAFTFDFPTEMFLDQFFKMLHNSSSYKVLSNLICKNQIIWVCPC